MAIVFMITASATTTKNVRMAKYATEAFVPQAVKTTTIVEMIKFVGTDSVFLDATSMKNALPARSV
jgi:Mg-chelatase subunit ChlD